MRRRLVEGWGRLRALWRRDELEDGLDEEIRFHVEQQTAKNRDAGLSPEEARRQALIRFGGVEYTREHTRDEFRAASLEHILRDLRYGTRALRRAPGFAGVAGVTLALGIGATTAMFSVVNGVLLRPLPYPAQDRLIELVHEAPSMGLDELFASPAIYFAYRDYTRTFESVGLWDWDQSPATVTGAGEPESVESLEVTHEILPILGATPIVGRTFNATDDRPGGAATAMISYGYWQRRFGGAGVVDQTLIVNGVPRRIIGVLPPAFRFFDYAADIFYPMQLVRADARFPAFDGRGIARLKAGVTLAEANADVVRVLPTLAGEFNTRGARLDRWQLEPRLRPLRESVVGDLGETLWLLMGTIGLLLVIACANVANLVLVRTQSRRHELVIRSALGANWAAVTRVVFAESALLGLIGGLGGVAVAYLSLPALLSLGAADLPQLMVVTIDWTVMLVAIAIAVGASILFAIVPTFQLALPSLRLAQALYGTRGATTGREGTRTRHLLVVAQVAVALVLLTGSGLMIRTFVTLRQVDPGFRDPDAVQTFRLTLPPDPAPPSGDTAAAERRARVIRVQHAIADRLAEIPGVVSVGFSSGNDGLPLDGDGSRMSLLPYIDGRQPADGTARLWETQRISPGFFETLGTTIVAGRTLDWNDVENDRPAMLVSENVARKEWGSATAALGRRISADPGESGAEIVGVIRDVRLDGLNLPAPPTVMLAATGNPVASFVVRSDRVGTTAFLADVRRAVWAVDGNLSLAGVQTLGELYQRSMARASMTLQLLAITGVLALLLGLIGIYGIVSFAVAQRRREIGIRLALGARRGEVRRMFVGRALALVTVGVAIGLAASAGLTRLMASQLFGVSPLDVPTHASVSVGLLLAAAAASYLSAARGARLDPVMVLKGDD